MQEQRDGIKRAAALAVHLFTASGAAAAFMALHAVFAHDYAGMFAWLGAAFLIDGVDGALARRFEVQKFAPNFDGGALDLVIDFLTYVFVPLAALQQAGRFGEASSPSSSAVCAITVAASAMYFADRRMKTADFGFRGFPALWNVVALYAFAFRPAPLFLSILVLALGFAMFAPIEFVHPMRVRRLRPLTLAMMAALFVCACLVVADGFAGGDAARSGLLLSGLYFVVLTLWRTFGGGADYPVSEA